MTAGDLSQVLASSSKRAERQSAPARLGRFVFDVGRTFRDLSSLSLQTLIAFFSHPPAGEPAFWPLLRKEIARSGVRLLPWAILLSAGLGMAVVGQTLSVLSDLGARQYLGVVLVSTVIHELGPIVMGMMVLSVTGTATVIELGMARTLGQLPDLESEPNRIIYRIVAPRVLGFGVSILSLTAFFITLTLVFAYVVVFLQNVPLTPINFGRQIAASLTLGSFAAFGIKSFLFGAIIGIVTCHEGLVRPVTATQLSRATIRAVISGIVLCAGLDTAFITYRLLL